MCIRTLYTFSREDILLTIDTAVSLYPEDSEIAFWEGSLYLQLEMDEKAAEMLKKAKDTNNGVIMYQLKEMEIAGIINDAEEI